MVLVIRYAVVTHAWPARSLRSSAMTRIALATMVWSRAARNIPIMSPTRIVTISRCDNGGWSAAGAPGAALRAPFGSAVVSDMSVLFLGLVLKEPAGVEGHRGRRCTPGPEVGVEHVTELAQSFDEGSGLGALPVGEQPLEPLGPRGLDAVE